MDKRAAIIGCGKSGLAASRLLKADGYEDITCFDDHKSGCRPFAEYANEYDITVVSPGIPMDRLPVKPDKYISEVELACRHLPTGSKVLGVTGTNGKSTVTYLTAQILRGAGIQAVECGNIGYAFGDAVLDRKAEVYVLELSSFQLELLQDFTLYGAVITNLTPDHLDRYGTMDKYVAAKLRIVNFIDPEGVLTTEPDLAVVNTVLNAVYRVRYLDRDFMAWPKLLGGGRLNFGPYYVDLNQYNLFGKHNAVNLAFALSLADSVASFQGDVTPLTTALQGMSHRTEKVNEIDGVTWINDSKATNIDSTYTALRSCEFPTIVLLGGRDKKGDFTRLIPELNRTAAMVCTFGEAAGLITDQITEELKRPLMRFDTLQQAVEHAYASAKPGYTVILSPGCTSYDEFNNFEERGEKFADYIKLAALNG